MQRYNRTNFTSSSVAKQLIAACREVLEQGHSAYLANRQGKRWMRVSVHGENLNGTFSKQHFEFYAGSGQDVGSLILQASFEWSHELQDEFFQVMAELSRLKDHVWNVVCDRRALEDAQETRKRADDAHAKLYLIKRAGATHKAVDGMGFTVYLSYKKKWFGMGKTVTTAYCIEQGTCGDLRVISQEVHGQAFTIQGML